MAEMCSSCGASFGSPSDLVLHMRKVHPTPDPRTTLAMNPESGIPGLPCALCGMRFSSREALERHCLSPHWRSNSPRPRPTPAPYY
jgi:uncharacterized C2H2 Zn-finger protein